MIRNKTIYTILILTMAMICTACADINLCDEQHEMPTVQYSFNWGKNSTEKPDEMYVIAHRIINDWTRVEMVGSDDETDTITVRPGEYKFFALPTEHNAFNLPEKAVQRVQDLILSYKLLSKQQILHLTDEEATADDKIARYIEPFAKPFFFDSLTVTKLTSGNKPIKFAPKPITQSIDFEFFVQSATNDDEEELEYVIAEITGVPASMQIGSRYVDAEHTVSAIIPLEICTVNLGTMDGPDVIATRCNGTINVPTILISEDEDDLNGPGVLTLTVVTSHPNADGEKVMEKKVFHKNLKRQIESAELSKYADDGEHIIRNVEHASIVIATPFKYGK